MKNNKTKFSLSILKYSVESEINKLIEKKPIKNENQYWVVIIWQKYNICETQLWF